MASQNTLFFLLLLVSASIDLALGNRERDGREKGAAAVVRRGGHRVLMGFKEIPSGGNATYECSVSGPCVPCLYSEKKNKNYRCSETGYRIPFKCVEIGASSNEANGKKGQSRSTLENNSANDKPHVILHNAEEFSTLVRQRSLLADSSTSASGSQAYITYRSCLPSVNEEKLSVLGFEGIIVGLLLMSGSFVYFRRKQSSATSGVGFTRIPTNSRF